METWSVGPYTLSADGLFRLGAAHVPLSPLQRRLLLCFVRNSGRLLEKGLLMREVWGHPQVSDVSMARAVHGLRQILNRGPLGSGAITTAYGSGYIFEVPVALIDPVLSEVPSGDRGETLPGGQAFSYYLEAFVSLRRQDPGLLDRAEDLLRTCLRLQPDFMAAIVLLADVLVIRCSWGLNSSAEIIKELGHLIHRAQRLGCSAEKLAGLKVEALSLLEWKPEEAQRLHGSWLGGGSTPLTFGSHLLSFVRHLLATGRSAEALALLEPSLAPDLPFGWDLIAQAHLQMGFPDEAIKALQQLIRIDPNLPEPHLLQSVIQAHGAKTLAATASLQASGILERPFIAAKALVAYVQARCGQVKAAMTLLKEAMAVDPARLGMASYWALAALALDQEDTAQTCFDLALQGRCYNAPFLQHGPLLEPYAASPSVIAFRGAMAPRFGSPLLAEHTGSTGEERRAVRLRRS